jgi:hypothetical protein
MRVIMNWIDLAARSVEDRTGRRLDRHDTGAPVSPYTEPIWLNRTMGMFGGVRHGCGPPFDEGLAEPSKT